jgi:MFS family permease
MPLFLKGFTDSKFIISLALTLAGISGCVIPPIAGYLSDRTRTRYGRRRPFIFAGMAGMFIFFVSLPHIHMLPVVIVVSALLYFSVDAAQTPYMSLLPDITPPEQRGIASGVMNFFGNMGLIGCFFLSSRLWEDYRTSLFYVVALISAGCALAAVSMLQEPQILTPPTTAKVNLLGYLRTVLEEKNVMKFFVAQFFWWLGFWVIQSFLTLFMVEHLGATEGKALLAPLTATVVQTCLVLPLGILGDRLNRRTLLSCAIILWAALEFSIGFSRNFEQALFLVGATGIPLAAVTGIGYALMFDLLPSERTAEFVGIGLISMAAPQIFGPLIGGMLIDLYGYWPVFPVAAGITLLALPLLFSTRERKKEAACSLASRS